MKRIINKDNQIIRLSKIGLIFSLLLTTFFSCEKEKEKDAEVYFYLQGNPTTVDLSTLSVTQTYTVYSNGVWKIIPSSQEDWISIEPMEGNGDGTITVVTMDNNSPFARTLNLELSAVGMKHNRELEIRQAGMELVFNIEGDSAGLETDTDGTTQTYTIHSNGEWRIELEEARDWVSIDPAEGVNDGTFTITISENTAKGSRVANLAFYVYEQRQPLTFTINQEGTVDCIDIDGNEYVTVKIGDQKWMKENLRVTRYSNGDNIPNGLDNSQWSAQTSGAYAVSPFGPVVGVSNETEMAATYGLLYNWYAASDSRGLCPTGWRVPTDDDWKQLEMALGMSSTDADGASWRTNGSVGRQLKGTGGIWVNHVNAGTDASGFSAYPVSPRLANGTYDARTGQLVLFWSSTEGTPSSNGIRRGLINNNLGVDRSSQDKKQGYSIRCVRTL